jgi:hypothetical protein
MQSNIMLSCINYNCQLTTKAVELRGMGGESHRRTGDRFVTCVLGREHGLPAPVNSPRTRSGIPAAIGCSTAAASSALVSCNRASGTELRAACFHWHTHEAAWTAN